MPSTNDMKIKRKFDILYWFCKNPTESDILLIDKCQTPKMSYKIEENQNCVKWKGIHYTIDEIRCDTRILYDPTAQEYGLNGNKIFLKRKKSKHATKDADKSKITSKNYILKRNTTKSFPDQSPEDPHANTP